MQARDARAGSVRALTEPVGSILFAFAFALGERLSCVGESSELAESEADYHLATALASAGCPLELLRQIVLQKLHS